MICFLFVYILSIYFLCTVVCFLYVVDIWSVGCIMGELLTNRPVFAGSDCILQSDSILLDFSDLQSALLYSSRDINLS